MSPDLSKRCGRTITGLQPSLPCRSHPRGCSTQGSSAAPCKPQRCICVWDQGWVGMQGDRAKLSSKQNNPPKCIRTHLGLPVHPAAFRYTHPSRSPPHALLSIRKSGNETSLLISTLFNSQCFSGDVSIPSGLCRLFPGVRTPVFQQPLFCCPVPSRRVAKFMLPCGHDPTMLSESISLSI